MILEEFDASKEAVINPEMILSKIDNFPEVTISCFSRHLFEQVLTYFEPKLLAEIHIATGISPVYEIEYKGERFAQFQSYVGEPACVAMYEDLIAFGSKRLILIGNCGVLDKILKIVELLYPQRQSEMKVQAIIMLHQVTLLKLIKSTKRNL